MIRDHSGNDEHGRVKPVLVTGASGMVGARVVEQLRMENVPVRLLVRPRSAGPGLTDASPETIRGDTTNPTVLRRAVEGCRAIVHCACTFTVTSAFLAAGPEDTYRRGILDLTRRLLEHARTAHVDRFVYVSSVAVYSQDAPSPIREDAPLDPYSAYGRFKVRAEALVHAAAGDGLSTTIVRPCITYGPGDRHFGPAVRALASTVLLPLPDGGRHLVDLVHVDDLARLLCRAASADEAAGQIYNAASGAPFTLREIVEVVRRSSRVGRPWIVTAPGALLQRCPGIARGYLRAVAPRLADIITPGGLRYLTRDVHFDIEKAARELHYTPTMRGVDALAVVLGR
jgi:nucleoside-diphosphate-sugar epimerase